MNGMTIKQYLKMERIRAKARWKAANASPGKPGWQAELVSAALDLMRNK